MHHTDFYSIFCFFANLQSALGSGFVFFVLSLCVLILILAPCLGKLELIGLLPLPLSLPLELSSLRMISVEKPMTL